MRKAIVLLFVLLVLVTGVWAETYTAQPDGNDGKDAQVTNSNSGWNGGTHANLINTWGG